MERYIDANKLIWQVQDSDKYGTITKQVFISLLQDSETADVAPVIHAHWIEHPEYSIVCNCSNCGVSVRGTIGENYCFNCGAKMDEEVKQ